MKSNGNNNVFVILPFRLFSCYLLLPLMMLLLAIYSSYAKPIEV